MKQTTSQQIKLITESLGRRSIVFVGMMGCGKSSIGRMIAATLEIDFFDSDTEIEKAADMAVAEIFEKYGEEEFRRGEGKVIERLLETGPHVIAIGGGAFMTKSVRDVIGKHSISIWIRADIDLLLSRVLRKPGKRPLLATGDPKAILEKLSRTRNPVYALADLQIESAKTSKIKTRDQVLDALSNHNWGT